MHPVYHAKITVSTKNFPRSEGRKCGVKGLVRRGLMVWRWSSPPSMTKSKYIANLPLDQRVESVPLDLRSIPLDLRSICPFVASKYLRSYDAPVYDAKITVSTKNPIPCKTKCRHVKWGVRVYVGSIFAYLARRPPNRFNPHPGECALASILKRFGGALGSILK